LRRFDQRRRQGVESVSVNWPDAARFLLSYELVELTVADRLP
jgi:hypothetical protein